MKYAWSSGAVLQAFHHLIKNKTSLNIHKLKALHVKLLEVEETVKSKLYSRILLNNNNANL